MPLDPTAGCSQQFQSEVNGQGFNDILHFVGPNGQLVSWIDYQGLLQGNLTSAGVTGNIAIKPVTSDAIQYVSAHGNDSNDGLSWGSAKQTFGAFTGYTGTVRVAAGSYTLSTALTFTGSIVFACDPGAVLTSTAIGSRLVFNAANSGITGLSLVGIGATGTVQAVVAYGNNFVFKNNTVTNWGNSSGNGTLEIVGGNGSIISNNTFSNNISIDIFVNAVSSGTMSNISIVNNVAGEIIVHTSISGANINQLVVSGNLLSPGQASKTEFGIEIGAFGGNAPTTVAVANNNIRLAANGTDGGISIGGCTNFAVTGNTFDSNGFTFTNEGLEVALSNNGTVSGNTVFGGGGNAMDLDHSSYVAMTGNTISGFTLHGIFLGVTNTNAPLTANNNTVSNNIILFSAGGTGNGIFIQCNEASGTVNNNVVMGNVIVSDGTAGSVGIKVENDSGTINANLIAGNVFSAPATSYTKSGTAVMATFVTET